MKIWPLSTRPSATNIVLLVGIIGGILGFSSPCLRGADVYNTQLEKRVELLERELDIIENDRNGKNIQQTEVPTFLKAAGKQVQTLTLSGELRFRYNFDDIHTQIARPSGEQHRSRYRYRLRLNFDYEFSDHWFAGIGLTSAAAADTGHQTLGEGFDNYGIYLNMFFFGWKINDNATVVMGKVLPPFYSNSEGIIDYPDIRPQGLTEIFNFDLNSNLNLKFNLGQYIFYSNPGSGYAIVDKISVLNPDVSVPYSRKVNAWFMYQDAVLTYKPTNNFTLTTAPAFFFYPLHGSVGVTGAQIDDGTFYSDARNNVPASPQGRLLATTAFNSDDATRSLYVGLMQGDAQFPIKSLKAKFYYDFTYNFRGGNRAYGILHLAEDALHDRVSWLTGLQLGVLKERGDWYLAADFRQLGLASIDPNLLETNFGLSRLNVQGFHLSAGYNFYTWLRGEVIYFAAWNLDKNLHSTDPGHPRALILPSFLDENDSQNLIIQLTASF